MEHRFRPVKEQSKALRQAVAQGLDPKDLDILDKAGTIEPNFLVYPTVAYNFSFDHPFWAACLPLTAEIARVFGGSTPDGVQFQFRAIRKEAAGLLVAANNGESPPERPPQTPRGRKPGNKATATGTAKTTTPTTASSRGKRKSIPRNYKEIDSKESDSTEVDYDALDETPVTKKVRTSPTKMSPPGLDAMLEGAQATSSAPLKVRTATQEPTPSETDHSAQTSPILKLETQPGNAFPISAPHVATPSRTFTESASVFGNGQRPRPAEMSFGQFNDNQPPSFTFSFGGRDDGAVPQQTNGFPGSASFSYSQQSFSDGEA